MDSSWIEGQRIQVYPVWMLMKSVAFLLPFGLKCISLSYGILVEWEFGSLYIWTHLIGETPLTFKINRKKAAPADEDKQTHVWVSWGWWNRILSTLCLRVFTLVAYIACNQKQSNSFFIWSLEIINKTCWTESHVNRIAVES